MRPAGAERSMRPARFASRTFSFPESSTNPPSPPRLPPRAETEPSKTREPSAKTITCPPLPTPVASALIRAPLPTTVFSAFANSGSCPRSPPPIRVVPPIVAPSLRMSAPSKISISLPSMTISPPAPAPPEASTVPPISVRLSVLPESTFTRPPDPSLRDAFRLPVERTLPPFAVRKIWPPSLETPVAATRPSFFTAIP